MKFEYQAIDVNGGVVRGIVEASSTEKVLQILLHKQLHPIDIRPLTETTVELSRLNSLKRRLEGKPKVKHQPRPAEPSKDQLEPKAPKKPADWSYIIFLILMVGLLAAAVLG